ncbi:hypothetical protein SeMB42_g00848 [Synchytrium endobioticum]|uniref:Geranylgeranyl transferase type-2 subunit alpha n=1 Tax=Synchytrium endobioticum TaxID=286115 RepID=A0A507DB24_9FUNG|nr:hypothetical protein SeLEV6574_g01813 [Synchytrium endobioticum]TPX53367.1 hypothetical protein SeMB42_g00848 [Synchytrium endobioticum]
MSEGFTHGVKKDSLPPTALSQDADKARLARDAAKISEFKSLQAQMTANRRDHVYTAETLELTTRILIMSCDHYTAWNYRREILSSFFATLTHDEKQAKCNCDLILTQELVRHSPKSYWLWNHRRWVLAVIPSPNWGRECDLLDAMLNLDTRNFHAWDYRRYVMEASRAIRSPLDEFNYTTKKIAQNFSNYSAWHYRTKVYPHAFGAESDRALQVLKDFETVHSAIWTEPSDQSAWLYQRWLLGKVPEPIAMSGFYLLRASQYEYHAVLVFNQPVKVLSSLAIKLVIDEKVNPIPPKLPYCCTLTIPLTQSVISPQLGQTMVDLQIEVGQLEGKEGIRLASSIRSFSKIPGTLQSQALSEVDDNLNKVELANATEAESETNGQVPTQIQLPDSSPLQPRSVWEREYMNLKELSDIEPTSDWCKLTMVYILEELDQRPDEAVALLNELMGLDPLRMHYFEDLRSKFIWRKLMANMSKNSAGEATVADNQAATHAAYPNQNLSIIPQPHLLAIHSIINLSQNILRSMSFVRAFAFVKVLGLDDNAIERIEGLGGLPVLDSLSLKRNRIRRREGLIGLGDAKRLYQLYLEGNEVCNSTELFAYVKGLVPSLHVLDYERV